MTLARRDGRLGARITPSQVDCAAAMSALVKARGTGGPPPEEPRLRTGAMRAVGPDPRAG